MNDKEIMEILTILKRWIERANADACQGCKYIDVKSWELPCSNCRNTHPLLWELSDEEN